MAKVEKELKSKIEDAIKDLENITCEDPVMSEMRHKNIKEFAEKLMKENKEKQIKRGSVDKLKL